MAVLSRDEFFDRLNERLSTDTSDEGIQFLEDMTDTYNSLEQQANGEGTNWEQMYRENDAAWKERYRHRFFSSDGGNSTAPNPDEEDGEERGKRISIEDLFV